MQAQQADVTVREGHPATVLILDEVRREREAQDVKWGVQRHLSVVPGTCLEVAHAYGVPTEDVAKALCDQAFKESTGTWGHIAIEEIAEVVGCCDDERKMRVELVQLAAVCVAWIEDIDRRNPR